MHTATAKQHAKPKLYKLYNPRHPEHTRLYRTVAEHFETWLELASAGQFDGQGHITLTPLELIDRIAALVPLPRTHRHRYFGVLAPNSPLRAAAVAMAAPAQQAAVQTGQDGTGHEGAPGVAPDGNAGGAGAQLQLPQPAPPKRSTAHYLWAALSARIYEVFPLLCPMCGGQMRLIAFITEGTEAGKILEHIGVESEPPRISPARGPPLWDDCDAQVDEGVEVEPDWDLAVQPAPDYEVDQRVNW